MESVRCVSVMISASILCFCIIMTSCLGFVGLLISSMFKYAMLMCFAYGMCIGCVCGVDVLVVFGMVISLLNLAALVVCVIGVFVGAAVLLVLGLLLLLSLSRQDPVVPPPLGGGSTPGDGRPRNLLAARRPVLVCSPFQGWARRVVFCCLLVVPGHQRSASKGIVWCLK